MRYPTYWGTEEVVYLGFGDEWLGLRPADGGTHRYYGVGLEHLAFEVDTGDEVDEAHQRCSRRGDRIHHPPEQDSDISDYYAFFAFDPDGLRIEVFLSRAGVVLAHSLAFREWSPTESELDAAARRCFSRIAQARRTQKSASPGAVR